MNALFIIVIILLALLGLFLFMIKPNGKRDVVAFTGKAYAHRGLHDDVVPENSLAAFRLAAKKGYGVELDVQMTKDGQLVVFHDGTLKRMTGVDGWLRDYTFEELEEFRLLDTDEKIPLFKDVLEVLGHTGLVCEIKGDNGNMNYELCEKTWQQLKDYQGSWCMESFSPFLVRWFKENHPQIVRGQLSCHLHKNDGPNAFFCFCMTHLLVNCISRPDFIAYRHKDTAMLGYWCCSHLFHPLLIAWTARGPKEQEEAWKHFDSVIFEQNGNAHPVE